MSTKRPTILLVERSAIVRSGLALIFGKKTKPAFLLEEECEEVELPSALELTAPDILIANPSIYKTHEKFIKSHEAKYRLQKIGLIYSYFDPEDLSAFDAIIHLNDRLEVIHNTIGKLLENTSSSKGKSNSTLSEREKEVLRLIVSGSSTKQIAKDLFLSPHTVNAHRKNIMRKLDIKTISGLTIYAVLNNIISLSS